MSDIITNNEESVLIIGNGESVLKYKLGSQIDKFKNIVRINNYRTNNFQLYSGTKTTIWFNGANQGLVKRKLFPEKVIVSIPSEILASKKNIKSHVIKRIKTINFIFVYLDKFMYYEKKGGHKRLTTGMYAIMWALENYNYVYIHGYDFFINSKGHYFDNKFIKSLKNNNLIKKGRKHNNNLEKSFILKLITNKKLKNIID